MDLNHTLIKRKKNPRNELTKERPTHSTYVYISYVHTYGKSQSKRPDACRLCCVYVYSMRAHY